MYLVFDTETTGLANFGKPAIAPEQPNLVQLAALLCNNDGTEIASLSTIVQPNGWIIPTPASNVHGITTEMAKEKGISLQTTLELFAEFLDIADTVVAHNIKYDMIVIRKAVHDLGFSKDIFDDKRTHCTKDASTPILKIKKPTGGFKWPTLTEAHRYFFGKDFDGAHGALEDARACSRVYIELVKMGAFNAA